MRQEKEKREAQLMNYVLSGFHESLNQQEKERVPMIMTTSAAFMACLLGHHRAGLGTLKNGDAQTH